MLKSCQLTTPNEHNFTTRKTAKQLTNLFFLPYQGHQRGALKCYLLTSSHSSRELKEEKQTICKIRIGYNLFPYLLPTPRLFHTATIFKFYKTNNMKTIHFQNMKKNTYHNSQYTVVFQQYFLFCTHRLF